MPAITRHIREDRLEAYLLNRLPAQQAANLDDSKLEAIELHLLICGKCQQRAEILESTLAVIRKALASEHVSGAKVRTAGA